MQAHHWHQHEQNCLQIDPAMNRTIYSTPKLSWASDHERKFNFGRTSKSQWINQNQIRMMQAHQHEQNCIQIDPAMNQTIYSTPKLSWAWDHERKFNLHKVLQLNFFSFQNRPEATGQDRAVRIWSDTAFQFKPGDIPMNVSSVLFL